MAKLRLAITQVALRLQMTLRVRQRFLPPLRSPDIIATRKTFAAKKSATDPVCSMTVRPESRPSTLHKRKSMHFREEYCRDEFVA